MKFEFSHVRDFEDFAEYFAKQKKRIKELESENYELEKANLELRFELENLIITQLPSRKEMSI